MVDAWTQTSDRGNSDNEEAKHRKSTTPTLIRPHKQGGAIPEVRNYHSFINNSERFL